MTPTEAVAFARSHTTKDAPAAIRITLKASTDYCRTVTNGESHMVSGYSDGAALLLLLKVLEPHARGIEVVALASAVKAVTAARIAALRGT